MSLNSLKSENNYTSYNSSNIRLFNEDVMKLYDLWDTPTVIISDGAYGVSGFPGDTKNYKDLPEWYEPHIKKMVRKSYSTDYFVVMEYRTGMGNSSSSIIEIWLGF